MGFLPELTGGEACFFDLDGTLAEIAPRPEMVVVDAASTTALGRLAARLDGAVAIVSGRAIAEVDRLLAPLVLPVAGVHGTERRAADGACQRADVAPMDEAQRWLTAWTAAHPGARLETKRGALALHFRGADALEPAAEVAMARARALAPGARLLRGKKLLELTDAAADKGAAVGAFLAESPFRGRRPWFFGDDVTDEAAFAAVNDRGGVSVRIGPGATIATHRIDAPAALRAWLERQLIRLTGEAPA